MLKVVFHLNIFILVKDIIRTVKVLILDFFFSDIIYCWHTEIAFCPRKQWSQQSFNRNFTLCISSNWMSC